MIISTATTNASSVSAGPLFRIAILCCVVAALTIPTLVGAEVTVPAVGSAPERPLLLEIPVGTTTEVSGLEEYLSILYEFIIAAIAILSAVMLMFNGMRWATAGGSSETLGVAKGGVINAIIGLLIALTSFVLLNVINPALVNFGRLSLPGIITPERTVPGVGAGGRYAINGCSLDNLTLSGSQALPTVRVCTSGNIIEGLGQPLARSEVARAINIGRGQISPILILAIMKKESSFCSNAFSSAYACGVIQTLPGTARRFDNGCGINLSEVRATACNEIINNPEEAICMGARYLNENKNSSYARAGEEDITAAYNGGTCGKRADGSWNGALCDSRTCQGLKFWECEANTGYAETRNYVIQVGRYKDEFCRALGGTVIINNGGPAVGAGESDADVPVEVSDGICEDAADVDDPDCVASEDESAAEEADASVEEDEAVEEADGECADAADVDDPDCV